MGLRGVQPNRSATEGQLAACPEGARIIPLTQGWICWVDEADHEAIARYHWFVIIQKGGQAAASRNSDYVKGRRRHAVFMHREIMAIAEDLDVDHRIHHESKKLIDNRRSNLRPVTRTQNCQNWRKRRGCGSLMKGVNWSKSAGKWIARIQVDGKRIFLGYFTEEAHAAYVYDLAALRHFGEFALVNFPLPGAQRWLFGPGGIQEAA